MDKEISISDNITQLELHTQVILNLIKLNMILDMY